MYESSDLAKRNSFLPSDCSAEFQTPLNFPGIENTNSLLKAATQGKLISLNKVNKSNLQSRGSASVAILIILSVK